MTTTSQPDLLRVPLVIDDAEIDRPSGGDVIVTDPATGEPFGRAALAGAPEAQAALETARRSFEGGAWRGLKPAERGRIMQRIAETLLRDRQELAELLVRESGKPLRDAYWEVDCSARLFEFYGGFCDKLQGTSVPLGPGWMDWTIREPIGVSLHIVPWNYPLQVAVRGIAPALAAGCTVLLKPSTETPLSAHRLARSCDEAGLPRGTLTVVPGRGSEVGDILVTSPVVDQITFTGSVETGQQVMQAAAKRVIPLTMELGGKSPQILFDDADLERALPIIKNGIYCHAGQVCNAGTRLLIHDTLHDRVVSALHEAASSMRLGRGLDDPDMGPVISADQRDRIGRYVEAARDEGGSVLVGAPTPSDPELVNGSFVSPMLVTGLHNDAVVAREEIFGPVLTVLRFDDDEQAFDIANDSDFGLVAGVFTRDIDRAMAAAEQLRVGQVWINSFGIGLDVEFPFGGYKQSGFGREKGLEALAAYTAIKNVCVGFA